jgi:hypothetical protein
MIMMSAKAALKFKCMDGIHQPVRVEQRSS